MADSPPFPPPVPSLPSSLPSNAHPQHARLPSRSERYESIVQAARDLYDRSLPPSHDCGAEDARRQAVLEEEWRECVRGMLGVVEGMTKQLATHDELAASLKIAQSNLILAEANSDFLAETLRRRDAAASVRGGGSSTAMTVRHSTGTEGTSFPPSGTSTAFWSSSPSTHIGLGFGGEETQAQPTPRSFFRIPSRKKLNGTTTAPPGRQQSPHRANFDRSLSSPATSFSSTSSTASSSPPTSVNFSSPPGPEAFRALHAELAALKSRLSSLQAECSQLRASNSALSTRTTELERECSELEVTKGELMDELEKLSVELFSEANEMVAGERKRRARADDEARKAKEEVARLDREVRALRARSPPPSLDLSPSTSLSPPPPTAFSPPPPGTVSSLPSPSLSPATSFTSSSPPSPALASSPLPTDSSSLPSHSWFSFRSPSDFSTPPTLSISTSPSPARSESTPRTPISPSVDKLDVLLSLLSSEDLFTDEDGEGTPGLMVTSPSEGRLSELDWGRAVDKGEDPGGPLPSQSIE